MLRHAQTRFAPTAAQRVSFFQRSFFDALPRADSAVASLALHHIHHAAEKQRVYSNIRNSIAQDGVLIIADAALPASPRLSRRAWADWTQFLMEHGDSEAEANARFEAWALEDRYFPIEAELNMLREAGFSEIDVRWRRGPLAVLVALA
jgi:tRNA (cmo5U34)-methyltransferase